MDVDLDKPLEAIIEEKRAARRASRGKAGGRGAPRGTARGGANAGRGASKAGAAAASSTGPVRNKHTGGAAAAAAAGPAAQVGKKGPVIPLMADGSKIIVSNLPIDVTENQIRDLFTQTVGQVTRVQLSYDKNGKSTGKAEIDFRKPGDAQIAYNSYNTRLVDGNRPMKVEIIFDPSRLPPPPLNSRIAPAAAIKTPVTPTAVAASGPSGRGAPRGRAGRGRGGRGRGGKRGDERPKVTEEDLDAQMEDYQKNLGA